MCPKTSFSRLSPWSRVKDVRSSFHLPGPRFCHLLCTPSCRRAVLHAGESVVCGAASSLRSWWVVLKHAVTSHGHIVTFQLQRRRGRVAGLCQTCHQATPLKQSCSVGVIPNLMIFLKNGSSRGWLARGGYIPAERPMEVRAWGAPGVLQSPRPPRAGLRVNKLLSRSLNMLEF